MITAKQLKTWVNTLSDETLIGVEDDGLIAREPDSKGLEEGFNVGFLPAYEEEYTE